MRVWQLQRTGCETDVNLGNAEPNVTNSSVFPKARDRECAFRSSKEDRRTPVERISRREKESKHSWSKVSFSKAKKKKKNATFTWLSQVLAVAGRIFLESCSTGTF